MSLKNVLLPFHWVNAASMAGNVTSAWTDVGWLDNIAIYIVYTGTPTGTFAVNTSPDKVNAITALPLSGTPMASGVGDTIKIGISQLEDKYIQLVFNQTGGSGTMDAYISAKEV